MKTNIYNFRFLLAFFIAMLFGAANLQAQTAYNLWICGEQVTDANRNDLSVINGVTGTVTYDTTTKILRLENATITATNKNGIESDIYGFTIDIVGNNTITVNGANYSGILHKSNGSIDGSGTLTVNAPSAKAISAWNGNFYIRNCTLKATGGTDGICGSNSNIQFVYASITAIGSVNGSIHGFKAIYINNCFISSPTGAKVTNGSVTDADGNIIKSEVKTARSYKLYICGKEVTDVNKDDLSVIDGVDGIVNYNPETKTLRLENSTITTSVNGISTQMDSLNIEIVGNNTITTSVTSKGIGFSNTKSTIFGSGKLTINAPSDISIHTYGSSLTIKNCTITANGGDYGFYGNGGSQLIIDGATITATGTKYGSIKDFSNGIILTGGSKIIQPVGGKILNGNVCDSNNVIVKTEVKIGVPKYDLWICGTQVTDNNKDDLSVINGANGCTITGAINYNSDTKTLTFNNANITIPNGANAIRSSIDGLTVDVQNNNTVNSDGWATMRFEKSATINGGGTLSVSQTSGGWALFAYGGSFNIENCTVNATSSGRAITSKNDNSSTLTINNATITAKGNVDGSITHFANITLNGCVISKPVGAVISKGTDTFYAVRDTLGNIITDTVKIKPIIYYDLWICGEQVTNLNKDDLSGTFAGGTVTGNNVSYNTETNTLTLDGADISSSNIAAIETFINGLKIDVIGTNTITSNTNQEGISFRKQSSYNSIEGSGSLTVNAPNYNAIRSGDTLVIKNCTINATGELCGISGGNGGDKLIFDNATVSATGTFYGSIILFDDIELISCAIVKPSDAEFNPSQDAICAADTIVKTEVKIIPAYDLWVCGEQVTVANKNDLRGTFAGGTVTGNNVNYNPETNTLTLDGATISSSSSDGYGSGITIKINGLKIDVIGTNTVTSTANVPGIGFDETSSNSIEGNGTLMVSALNDCDAFFVHNVDTLTIKNCKLTAIGSDCGIYGNTAKLIIDNATVSAKGKDGSIRIKDMELIGCAIVEPAGAVFDTTKHAICAADTIVKTEVKIMPFYTINFATPEHGSITVKQENNVINSGDNVFKESEITITATPDNGYKLKTLTVNGNPFESGNTHIVVADVNIVAEFVITGIEDFAAQGITIYPNPVQDILHIETKETITAVNIYNMLGSIVAQNTGDVREINISNLPAGIYMVRVEMGESVGVLQIVKK